MTIETFLNVSTKGAKSPDLPALEAWLRATLATVPEGSSLSTGELLAHAGLDEPDPVKRKKMSNALYVLRKTGRVADCFEQDGTRRWMGHPLIMWHRPTETAFKEEIF
jgi:hypothetical protein